MTLNVLVHRNAFSKIFRSSNEQNLVLFFRARNYVCFVADLFVYLKPDRCDWKNDREVVLAQVLIDAVQKLIEHPNNSNLRCSVEVLGVCYYYYDVDSVVSSPCITFEI